MFMLYERKSRRVLWHGLSEAEAQKRSLSFFVRFRLRCEVAHDEPVMWYLTK